MSDLARKHAPVGATFFAEYWFQALDWAYATADSTVAKSLFAAACTECVRTMHNFDLATSRGETFHGGRITVSRAEIAANDKRNGAEFAVDVTVDISAWETLSSDHKVINHGAARNEASYRVWVAWYQHGWSVVDYRFVKP